MLSKITFIIASFIFSSSYAYRILIDPGHGGRDLGAKQASHKEANIAWAWSLELKKLLSQKGFEVELTRNETRGLSLHKRIARVNEKKYDLVLSLHANYILDPQVKGTEYFVTAPLNLEDQKLQLAHEEIQVRTGEKKISAGLGTLSEEQRSQVGAIIRDLQRQSHMQDSLSLAQKLSQSWNGKVRQGPFDLLAQADSPAILIELGYMSNPADLKNLIDPQFRLEKSLIMAETISAFFKLQRPNDTQTH